MEKCVSQTHFRPSFGPKLGYSKVFEHLHGSTTSLNGPPVGPGHLLEHPSWSRVIFGKIVNFDTCWVPAERAEQAQHGPKTGRARHDPQCPLL